MNKDQAQRIIKDTFENKFDRARFTGFIVELLNLKSLAVSDPGVAFNKNQVPNAHKPFISSFEKIADYRSGEHKLDVLVIRLNRETSIERARTMQRNFIAWYLRGDCDGEMKDASLAAFVSPDEEDWRFSLIKIDYSLGEDKKGRFKISEEFTPAKRWSFLVGSNEKSHTAQSQLIDILAKDEINPTLAQLEESFNIETVTKEFFKKYKELFFWTKETLDELISKDNKIKSDFETKNINTVDFSKKLLGQIVFLYFLQKKGWFGVARDADWGTGPKNFLRELFDGKHGKYNNFFNDILEPLFYNALRIDRSANDDYHDKFNCKIPFLNGGLFDPIGEYDWVHTDINLSDELFSNLIKTKEGDTGTGVLDIFDRYNFTVKEDEPLEKEVAVDPEMLGKVFENLLEVKDRKSKGTYYTPREIVHYMCQQSIINYLATEMEGRVSKDDIEKLIKYGEQFGESNTNLIDNLKDITESIIQNAKLIDKKLFDIKVCDPAVGSGAFLVGTMGEIVRTRNVLSNYLKDPNRTIYNFKRECIENSLYGVDIDPGAIEIAKLRLWLSLVVDEEDIKQIKPLPNLDYKIVCGNSLMGIEKNLFNQELFGKLESLKKEFFDEVNPNKKKELKYKINEIINRITNCHKDFDFEIYFSEVFHQKAGFDIVIANPPYVRVQNLSYKEIDSYKKKFKTAYKRIDISILFIELGLNLLNDKGNSVYITSSQFTKTEYGKNLRELLHDHIASVIYFGDNQMFQMAVNYTSLFFISRASIKNVALKFINAEKFDINESLSSYISEYTQHLNRKLLTSESWGLDSNERSKLIQRLKKNSEFILDDVADVDYGLVTGLDRVFVFKKDGSIKLEDSLYLCKLLKPSCTDRYCLHEPTHYVIYPYKSTSGDTVLVDESTLRSEAVKLYEYLLSNKEALLNRRDSREDVTNKKGVWYSLMRHSSFKKVQKEKILTQALCMKNEFCLDERGLFFTGGSIYSISSKRTDLSNKGLLGLLNSKLCEFYYQLTCPIRQHGYRFYAGNFLKLFPIPQPFIQEESRIANIVDKILAITKSVDYLRNLEEQAKVKEYEKQIDQLVYKLYSLTQEEIKILESSNNK